jgi:hypothetical protein
MDMSNGEAVKVMSQDGKRLLFIGSYRYERDGQVRVFRMGHTTLVEASRVKPLKERN